MALGKYSITISLWLVGLLTLTTKNLSRIFSLGFVYRSCQYITSIAWQSPVSGTVLVRRSGSTWLLLRELVPATRESVSRSTFLNRCLASIYWKTRHTWLNMRV
ncbi:hypothetical protein LINPERHAP2_LOCUS31878 [Linum perenne]